jgi:hypothetical protein
MGREPDTKIRRLASDAVKAWGEPGFRLPLAIARRSSWKYMAMAGVRDVVFPNLLRKNAKRGQRNEMSRSETLADGGRRLRRPIIAVMVSDRRDFPRRSIPERRRLMFDRPAFAYDLRLSKTSPDDS